MAPEELVRSTTEIQAVSHGIGPFMIHIESTTKLLIVIEENGVRLRLNIVDTPGYGDQVNNDRWLVTNKHHEITAL